MSMTTDVIHQVPLDRFICLPQVRERLVEELIGQIALSMRTVGQLQPVRGQKRGDIVEMIDGHHRLEAAKRAGLKTLATIIEAKELPDGEVVLRQLISNCQREDLTALEKARGIQRLMETANWTAQQAATGLGVSSATVTRLLKLLSLPVSIVEQVEAGKIAASSAYELAQIDDPARQTQLANQLAAGQLTRDGVSGVRKAAKKANGQSGLQRERVTAMLGENRYVTVVCAELTLERFIEQLEELLGKARRVRTQGVALETFLKMLRDRCRAQ
jgi:ParB family chromosome partitioning protein